MPAKSKQLAPRCYSYLRFSSKEQAKGDSIRRQTEARDQWVARMGLALDEDLVLTDRGISAFKGSHREGDRAALAGFLDLVKSGDVPRGSYLLVENLDRLSREHIRPALTLLLNLIDAGVKVVQLTPVEAVFDEKVEPMQLMMAVMELTRGHSESLLKSDRVGKAWKRKKERAALVKAPITRECPAWLAVRDGRFRVLRGATDTIRLVYKMAAEGHGLKAIVRHLNEKEIPAWGGRPRWTKTPVGKLLLTRRVVGEYQPKKGRVADGPPIPGFYPAVVTEDEWSLARQAMGERRAVRGPMGKNVYLWSGLLKDARDGATVVRVDKGNKGGGPKLVNGNAHDGGDGSYVSFPVDVFDEQILDELREIDPRDVLPGAKDGKAERTLTARRAGLVSRIERIQSQMVSGDEDVGPLVAVIRRLQDELDQVNGEIARADEKAATPLAHSWREAGELLTALRKGPKNETRARLRTVLRRVIDKVVCLFVGRGMTRLAAVRIQFRGDRHRDYVIVHQAAHAPSKRPARSVPLSFAEAGLPDDLDLRERDDAARVEKLLGSLDLAKLA